ncbi:hypothetical protein [Halomonas denitrificans]|nr:hypothetical protein [Halomonas denitrificans]
MKRAAFVLCLALGVALAAPASGDQLRGRFSNLAALDARLDIRIRFYDRSMDTPLAERRYRAVDLDDGAFELPVDASQIPMSARIVEVAIRPHARPYAAFQPVPPRRPLVRADAGARFASRPGIGAFGARAPVHSSFPGVQP